MSKKSGQSSLGKALQRQQAKKVQQGMAKVQNQGVFYHDSKNVKENYEIQTEKLQSIIDQDSLNEYLQLAELANTKYQAEKKSEVIVSNSGSQNQTQKQVVINVTAIRQGGAQRNGNVQDYQKNLLMIDLQIPRRPKWDEKTTVDQLRLMENESFLKWRRELAKFEEENYQIHLTPYEKNIEVWKQLWRVVEKSDILVQVVDGRDILFYHCNDLVKYVNEEQNRIYHKAQTKINFLLINKSDLISQEIRQAWSEFLNQKGINHMFFSAKLEQEKIDNTNQPEEDQLADTIQKAQLQQTDEPQQKQKQEQAQETFINTPSISDRAKLLQELKTLVKSIRQQRKNQAEVTPPIEQDEQHQQHDENSVIIGMVGYPNVGKSSAINALCNRKLVGVGARPGKTKHFQTLQLEPHLWVCDCPGLIFPNAQSTRAEMVCNGVLPIDNIKDYLSPVDLLCERIPKIVFEKLYGLELREVQDLDSSTLLQAYSKKRGFVTGRALPDEAKASKLILKDFVGGKLLYCKLPPNYKGPECWQSNSLENLEELLRVENERQSLEQQADANFDNQFENQLIAEKRITNEEIMELFTQDDLLQLMEGKRVHGIKLTKEQRREIKYTYQRGEPIEMKKYINLDKGQKETVYKTHIKGRKIQI